MRELLGGKGANLAEMAGLGLPVPQGFTITTEACTRYYDDGRMIADDIMSQVLEYVGKLEKSAGKKFGDAKNPLLVSVRSGARASMPGMMDTILNLGLNETVVEALAADRDDLATLDLLEEEVKKRPKIADERKKSRDGRTRRGGDDAVDGDA